MDQILQIIVISALVFAFCRDWVFSFIAAFVVVSAFSASKILGIMSLVGAGFFIWAAWQGETEDTRHRSGKNWRKLTPGQRSAIQRNRHKR